MPTLVRMDSLARLLLIVVLVLAIIWLVSVLF